MNLPRTYKPHSPHPTRSAQFSHTPCLIQVSVIYSSNTVRSQDISTQRTARPFQAQRHAPFLHSPLVTPRSAVEEGCGFARVGPHGLDLQFEVADLRARIAQLRGQPRVLFLEANDLRVL